jgi:hypothetical protein
MKRYLLSVVYPPDAERPADEQLQRIDAAVDALRRDMVAAGVWVFGGGLHDPTTATTVRVSDGRTMTTDGPFVESKEVLGGITIIDAADLDEALAWAERAARAIPDVPIEVRPFLP